MLRYAYILETLAADHPRHSRENKPYTADILPYIGDSSDPLPSTDYCRRVD
jgi:hypothetical protein